ncbi:unnamed protein product [Phytophthora lilii]|uniref:Unnamed protein product n=1 Tax=Phytophthora lilii TaxID=2077276 RepID=A0A9W6WYR4_9STRA|nr:unnamed protein product [Phytophthora lilii]
MLLCQPQQFHLDSFRMALSLQASIDAQDADGNTGIRPHSVGNRSSATSSGLVGTPSSNRRRTTAAPCSTYLDSGMKCVLMPQLTRIVIHRHDVVALRQKRTLEDNLYKLAFFVPWIVFPLACYVIVTVNGTLYIMLSLTALLFAAMLLLKLLQRGSYGDKRKAASLMFGINVASIGYLVGSFPQFNRECSTAFCTFAAVSFAMIGVTLFKTATSDPGEVFTSYEEKLHWQWWKWNTSLWRLLIGTWSSEVAAVTASTPGFFDWVWSVAHFQPVLFCVMLLDVVQIAWIAYMLFFHIYLMCAALTTNEVVKGENLDRTYSRGIFKNVVDFLGLPGQRPVDWRRVYNLDEFKSQVASYASSSGETRKDL